MSGSSGSLRETSSRVWEFSLQIFRIEGQEGAGGPRKAAAHRLALCVSANRWAVSEQERWNQRDRKSCRARTLAGFIKIWRSAKAAHDRATKTLMALM